jgi:acyl carrier protein
VGRVGTLSRVDLERITRSAMPPLGVDEGMELFDRAVRTGHAVLGLARLNPQALRDQPDVAPLWRSLAGAAPRRAAASETTRTGQEDLEQRLAGLARPDRDRILTDLVGGSAAAVLGHATGAQIDPDRAFSELGFDSLTSVELRNLLRTRTGKALPSSVVFDYPTVTQLAGYVDTLFGFAETDDDSSDEDTVRRALRTIPLARLRQARLLDALLDLAGEEPGGDRNGTDGHADEEHLLDADVDDLIDIALRDQ